MLRYCVLMAIGVVVFFAASAICGLVTAATLTYVGLPTSVLAGTLYWLALVAAKLIAVDVHKTIVKKDGGDED